MMVISKKEKVVCSLCGHESTPTLEVWYRDQRKDYEDQSLCMVFCMRCCLMLGATSQACLMAVGVEIAHE